MKRYKLNVTIGGREVTFFTDAKTDAEARQQAQAWAEKYAKGLDERGVAMNYFPPVSSKRA